MTLFDVIGTVSENQLLEINYVEKNKNGLKPRFAIGYLNDKLDNYHMDYVIESLGHNLVTKIAASPADRALTITLDGYKKAIEKE